MKLHELVKNHKRKQRVGRGGKRGTTAGRGTKGQRSRSGHRIRPAERDLILRLPKQRGFRNKRKSDSSAVFNIGSLSEKLKTYAKSGAALEVDIALLKTAGLIGKNFKGDIKVLAVGEMKFPMIFKGIKLSKGAQAKTGKK